MIANAKKCEHKNHSFRQVFVVGGKRFEVAWCAECGSYKGHGYTKWKHPRGRRAILA
jgi:hypothetical protein